MQLNEKIYIFSFEHIKIAHYHNNDTPEVGMPSKGTNSRQCESHEV